ncbi:hypothetical protein BMW24_004795 [Mycobacterium heckeshornense]|nr:FAD-dependent monooxygenase [Mycobacterium heckeshornense]KMV20112.1 hypothetical protein ACT16_20525 [Mycobacterium heckeshornense]MCV7032732.1 FAD-dependent monooxygenase [Mycobacterium heckeshornense]PIJ37005.1 hypothetical protein BMW24_004795 [Mycobacterium heckeshornense]
MKAARLGQRAVILGGSVAGLCAAAAVSPHFSQVVILERDELPDVADHRRGVPQSRHPHFLLNAGRTALEHLYPGIEAELIAGGALELNPGRDAAYCESRGWAPRKAGAMTMIYCSRILLERTLRDRACALANVAIRERTTVHGLAFDGQHVTGVRYSPADTTGGEETDTYDLVVDALGRGSKVAYWLTTAGFPAVQTLTLDAKVTYSSRWYRRPPPSADDWWWQLVVLPAATRGAKPVEHDYLSTIFPIENERWIAFMGSWGHEMPSSNDDFEECAQRIRTPAFSAALKRAEPISDVHVTRATANKWRRYDRLAQPPLGIISVGDSICAYNPLYGQGMSAAAVTAVILAETLDTTTCLDADFYRRFLLRQSHYLQIPWDTAITRDQGYKHAVGTEVLQSAVRRRLMNRLAWPMFNLLSAASREDPVIEDHFSRVFNIEQSLRDMITNPVVLSRLARYQLKVFLGRTRLPRYFDALGDPPSTDYSTP